MLQQSCHITPIDLGPTTQNTPKHEKLFSRNFGSFLVFDNALQGVTYCYQDMHYTEYKVHHGDVWHQFWCSQTFAQWAHQCGQSADSRVSDVVPLKGGLTHALTQKLQKPMIAAQKTNDSRIIRKTDGMIGPTGPWAPTPSGLPLGPAWALPGPFLGSPAPPFAPPVPFLGPGACKNRHSC